MATQTRYTAPVHSLGPTGPRFGDYQGLSAVLTPPAHDGLAAPVSQFLRHKRWMYTFAATDEIIVTCAIVDAGPTGTTFLTIADRRTGHLLADISRPGGLRPLISINDRPGNGHASRYRMPGSDVWMRTEDDTLRVRAKIGSPVGLPAIGKPAVDLDLTFDIAAQPALTVISELQTEPTSVSTTGKNAALPVTGSVTVRLGGFVHRFSIRGVGGFDYTSGHLPRHTLALGVLQRPVARRPADRHEPHVRLLRAGWGVPGELAVAGRGVARARPGRHDRLRRGRPGQTVAGGHR